jgi:hypothetical protein
MRDRLNEQVNRFKQIMSIISENTNDSIDFIALTGQVIDQLEGGYYHPDMRYRLKGDWSKYGRSGETMFGIDRLRGGSINTTSAGKEFWNLIDNANAKNTWKWNDKGGQLGERLKVLAAQMMKPQFELYMRKYLTPEAQKIVNSSKALTFNFIYATWNGPGWFQKFGKKFNEDVKSNLSIGELVSKVLQYRLDSGNRIIVDTGKKLEKILPNIENIKISPLSTGSSSDTGIASKDISGNNQPSLFSTLYNKFLDSQKASNKA